MTLIRPAHLIVAVLLILAASATALASDPLNLAAVETLLKGKVSQQRIVKLIGERKVSAHLNKETAKKLKRMGASEAVIEAIANNPFAEVVLTSEPAGAEIFIDGRYRGKTPARYFDIHPGKHELQVGRISGYQEYEGRVEVPPGHWEKKVTLSRGDAPEAVSSTPAQPADARNITDAPAPAPNAAPAPAAAEAKSAETEPVVSVVVRTEPVKASLYLDNRYIGVTPLNFLAPAGMHRLRLIPSLGSRYEEVEKDISIVRHGLNVVFLRLNSRRD